MPSKKLKEYIAADSKEKAAVKEKSGLRDYAIKLLTRCKRLGLDVEGVSCKEEERFKFSEDKLYEWAATQLDKETLEYITKRTVDLEKLQEIALEGKIDTTKAPESVYAITKYSVIRIDHKKVNL